MVPQYRIHRDLEIVFENLIDLLQHFRILHRARFPDPVVDDVSGEVDVIVLVVFELFHQIGDGVHGRIAVSVIAPVPRFGRFGRGNALVASAA